MPFNSLLKKSSNLAGLMQLMESFLFMRTGSSGTLGKNNLSLPFPNYEQNFDSVINSIVRAC